MTTTTTPQTFRAWRSARNNWRDIITQVRTALNYEREDGLTDEEVDRRTDLTSPLVKQMLATRAPSLTALDEKLEIITSVFHHAPPEAMDSIVLDVAALRDPA